MVGLSILFAAGVLVLVWGAIRPPAVDPTAEESRDWSEVELLERKGEADHEHVLHAYEQFLAAHPDAKPEHLDAARRKIREELPARIDDRDFRRAVSMADPPIGDPELAGSSLRKYLQDHPRGRHTDEVARVLDGVNLELAYRAVRAVEHEAGERYEQAVAAYRRFLAEYPTCPSRYRDEVTRMVEVELPERIEARDYRPLAVMAAAEAEKQRPLILEFLRRHPQGRHAQEARRLLESTPPWMVKVLTASCTDEYKNDGLFTNVYTPTNKKEYEFAVLEVEFVANFAPAGSLEDRLRPCRAFLTDKGMDYMLGGGSGKQGVEPDDADRRTRGWLSQPARLFYTGQVHLELPDGERTAECLTSTPPNSPGRNEFKGETVTLTPTVGEMPAVIRYIRGLTLTAALVLPDRPVKMTLVFPVPRGTGKAKFRFYDCPPIDLTFDTRPQSANGRNEASAKLDGDWTTTKVSFGTPNLTGIGGEAARKWMKWTFNGDTLRLQGDGKDGGLTYQMKSADDHLGLLALDRSKELKVTCDPTKSPGWIDLSVGKTTLPGIYSLQNGELQICLDLAGKARPDSFELQKGASQALFVLGPRTRALESYLLNIVVFDNQLRRLDAATVGVRIPPDAGKLTLDAVQLINRDGTSVGSDARTAQFGKDLWILFTVPSAHVVAGGLKLRTTKNGPLIPLPEKLEKKSVDDLEGR